MNTTILGGPNHFAIYYAGPKGAKPLAPLYNTGNVVNNLILNELDCNDGFSWSFQQNSSITNVTHTGSRLALYVDQSTTVTDYRYTPGAQQCGARNGFWLTPPADNITITNFTSSGEGGKVGIIGRERRRQGREERDHPGPDHDRQQRLHAHDRRREQPACSPAATSVTTTSSIDAQAIAEGTVSHCTFGQMVRSGAPSAQVNLAVVS